MSSRIIPEESGPLGQLVPRWISAVPAVVKDTILAVVLAGTLVIDLARQDVPPGGPIRSADPLGYVLVALLVLPLAVRTVIPRLVFGAVLAASIAVATVLYAPTSFGFGVIVATYTVGRWCGPTSSLIALGLAQAFAAFVKIRGLAAGLNVGWFEWPLDAAYMGAAWYLGRSIRRSHDYAAQLEANRQLLAHQAVQEERTHIARELHDAVGHSISVMSLHIGAAQQLVNKSPHRAEEALVSAGDVGRTTMAEMDHLLGILRAGNPGPDPRLQPRLSNLDSLVVEFEDLGLEVTTRVTGLDQPLPPSVEQAAFRIVQEALTNTAKHAGPTTATVRIDRSDDRLDLEVLDEGPTPGWRADHTPVHDGRGIIGMRERATLLHGVLEAGRRGGQGYRVAARLPVTKTASP